MPFHVSGVGTIYYGSREHQSDGSFVTTSWIVCVFLPLIPLASYRVWPTDEGSRFSLVPGMGRYFVKRVGLNWGQVIATYLVFYGPIILLFVLFDG